MRLLPTSGSAASALSVTVLAGCAVVMLAAILSGCASSPKVMVDQDPTVDLRQYKTFGYYDKVAADKTQYSTILTTHLKRATRVQLEQHGYSYQEDDPDLRVNFFLNVADRHELRSWPSTGRFGYRAWSGASYDLVEYRSGTLRIDLVDSKRNALVWQGIAQDRIGEGAIKNPAAAIDAVVSEVFNRLPDGAAK